MFMKLENSNDETLTFSGEFKRGSAACISAVGVAQASAI
jgi:hypothetical protein